MSPRIIGYHAAISLLIAAPAGGFILGILNAGDPDPNPIGRLVYACMMTVVTPLHAGFPPNDVAGAGQTFNAWPQIAVAFVLSFSCLSFWHRTSKRNRSDSSVPRR